MDPTRMFPIMGGADIPWLVISPHESQAQRNHGQSLKRLAERGGLSPCEAVDVLLRQKWGSCQPGPAAAEQLARIVKERHYLVEIESLRAASREIRETLEAAILGLERCRDVLDTDGTRVPAAEIALEKCRAALSRAQGGEGC